MDLPQKNPYIELLAEILSLLFPYLFVFYLILYLLETIIPGFVTENFSLNLILVPTLVFGVLSAIFPTSEDENTETPIVKRTTPFDLIFTIALSIGAFFLIFYKFKIDNQLLKWAVSLLSSLLTLFLGLMLLYFPDDVEEEVKEEGVEAVGSNKRPFKISYNFKRLLLSRLKIPVPVALVILLVLVVFIPQNTAKILNRQSNPVSQTTPTPSPTPVANQLLPADPSIKIIVFNAGAEKGEATRIGNLFKQAGYTNVEATDSAKKIDNALIEFGESNSAQADLVEDILRGEYLTVDRSPLSTPSAEIRVSLGAQPKPIDFNPDYQNENLDFFFN